MNVDVFVARQPIFDRNGQLYGYELLFRSDFDNNEFDGSEAASATMQVIANSIFSIGFENLVCGKKAFFNFNRSLLMGGLLSILPKESVVVEILESVEPDAEIVTACRELYKQGYTIALDDFVRHPRFEPLTEIAKLIKVDIQTTTKTEQEHLLLTYQPRGIAMLAEKVETREEFDWAHRAGYDLFQGYFFTRPVVVRGRQVPARKATCLQLLREVQRSDLDLKNLAALISRDVSLSHKLLQYVNSAIFYRAVEVRSIDHCLVTIGEDNIRHWVALAALPILAKDKPGEVATHSLVRARFCERLAQLSGIQEKELGFLMGLFSLLDALIDLPLEEALLRVNLPPAIRGSLLGTLQEDDPLRNVYGLVCRYEVGDWDAVTALAAKLKIKASDIAAAYAESALWAQQAMHLTAPKVDSRRKVRHTFRGVLRILWEDASGRERTSTANLMNISVAGLQVLVAEQIPVSTYVTCNDAKLGISGRSIVRYCNFSKGKYLIGMEFIGGSGWQPLAPSAQAVGQTAFPRFARQK